MMQERRKVFGIVVGTLLAAGTLGASPFTNYTVYNGELPFGSWNTWYGKTSFADQTSNVYKGTKSGTFKVLTNAVSAGIYVPNPTMWSAGWDISGSDKLEFWYRGSACTVYLISYNLVQGVVFSRSLGLPAAPTWTRISTNLRYFTNGQAVKIDMGSFTGFFIEGTSGANTHFDEIHFISYVKVKRAWVQPGVVTNTKKNPVTVWATVLSNQGVTNVSLDLGPLGGGWVKMSNVAGGPRTNFRYSLTVASNIAPGTYALPLVAYDRSGYRTRGWAYLEVVGKGYFTHTVIYDGDNVPARPNQWAPPPPPVTGRFEDVLSSGTVPARSGTLYGRYVFTNQTGGNVIFHLSDPSWLGLDVSTADIWQIWARGKNGGERLRLRLAFLTPVTNGIRFGRETNIELTANWKLFAVPRSLFTQGLGIPTDRFLGLRIEGVTRLHEVYLDDVAFVNDMRIVGRDPSPNQFNRKTPPTILFQASVWTRNNNVTSVTLDLTPLGGTKVLMTNLPSGSTNFRYGFTVPTTNITAGLKEIWMRARDDKGSTIATKVLVRVVSDTTRVMWDFEVGHAQGWRHSADFGTGGSSQRFCRGNLESLQGDERYLCTSDPDNNATNLDQRSVVYQGQVALGWRWPLTPKYYDSAEPVTKHFQNGGLERIARFAGNGTWWAEDTCSEWLGWGNYKDYSMYKGFAAYIYIDKHTSTMDVVDTPYGLFKIRIQSALSPPGWWIEGPMLHLLPNRWNKVWIDFNNCYRHGDDPKNVHYNIPLVDRQRIVELMVELKGGVYEATGEARVYLDYIIALDDVAPSRPTGLVAVDAGTGGTINLSWDRSSDADTERYHIYRSTVNDTNTARFVAATTNTFFVDKGAWNGQPHYYWVTAVDRSENESGKSAVAAAVPTGTMPNVLWRYKGGTVFCSPGLLGSAAFTNTLRSMRDAGVGTVGLTVRYYMNDRFDNAVNAGAGTIPDAELTNAIRAVQAQGMKVFLQPQVVLLSGEPTWRIRPSNLNAWFTSYSNFIRKYAQIAANTRVNLYSVGWNLNPVAQPAQDARWTSLINGVRAVYASNITFSALWGPATNGYPTSTNRNTYRNLTVWNKVDFIGINAWFHLDSGLTPNLGRLYDAWNASVNTNGNWEPEMLRVQLLYEWFDDLKTWQAAKGKPVIFTEFGIPSRERGAWNTWVTNAPGYAANNQVQRDGYEAMFRRFWDQPWFHGAFLWYWHPSGSSPSATSHSPQGKPAMAVVSNWYKPRPHHFSVIHDGLGEAMRWEKVVIQVHDIQHNLVPDFAGPVTLDISRGTPGAVSWTNFSTCGTLVDWGPGTAKAVFTFTSACGGVVTLGIKDNTMETVVITARSGGLREGVGESAPLLFTGPLGRFLVIHDGWGVRGLPERIEVRAMDVFNNVKIDFTGKVSLFVRGEANSATITWTTNGCNNKGTFLDGGGAVDWAVYTFTAADQGIARFNIIDTTAESVDVEAVGTASGIGDDDAFDPLRFIDMHHFSIYHDGYATETFPERFVLRTEDASHNRLYGFSGAVTLYLASPPAVGSVISMANISGKGTLMPLTGYRWVYEMVLADAGEVTLSIVSDRTNKLDLEARYMGFVDDDVEPRILWFDEILIHYVWRSSPNPVPPYATPETAAQDIQPAINAVAGRKRHRVLIIDSYQAYTRCSNIGLTNFVLRGTNRQNPPAIVRWETAPNDDLKRGPGIKIDRCRDVRVENIGVYGFRGNNPPGYGVLIQNSTAVTLRRLHLTNNVHDNQGQIVLANARHCVVEDCRLAGDLDDNKQGHILLDNGSTRNIIRNCRLVNGGNGSLGIRVNDSTTIYSNLITRNLISNLGRAGVWFEGSSLRYHDIVSNLILRGCDYAGLYFQQGGRYSARFNIIFGGKNNAIEGPWGASQNFVVRNNNLVSNAGWGFGYNNQNCTSATLRNNIIAFNNRGISSAGVYLAYNLVSSNRNGNYDWGGNTVGPGQLTNLSPRFLSVQPWSTNFMRLASDSPCIDAGAPYDPIPPGGGQRIDIGALETSNTCPSPVVLSFGPRWVVPGNPVTIRGQNFGPSGKVAFVNASGTPTTWTTTNIVVPVPTGAKTGPITITNSCGRFVVTPSNVIIMADLRISTTVSNVTLGGVVISTQRPIPGSTATIVLLVTNRSSERATNAVVYHRIWTNTALVSNSVTASAGWTIEWSTNADPLQTYNSAHYTTTHPAAGRVRWVRWKKPHMASSETARLRVRVTVR